MRISQEPPCDEFSGLARSAHTLREPAQSKCSWTFDKTHSLYVRILRKGPKLGTQTLHDPAQSNFFALGHPLCAKIRSKNAGAQKGDADCASLRSRHAPGHLTRPTVCENSQQKCRGHDRDADFVRANRNAVGHLTMPLFRAEFSANFRGAGSRRRLCAFCASLRSRNAFGHLTRSTLCENFQQKRRGPGSREILSKNAGAQMEHPHQAPAFTTTARTPQCGHTV